MGRVGLLPGHSMKDGKLTTLGPYAGDVPPQPPTPPVNSNSERPWFAYIFLVIQIVFGLWLLGGVGSAASADDSCTGPYTELCQDATTAGASIGIAIIMLIWMATDVILASTYFVFRRPR